MSNVVFSNVHLNFSFDSDSLFPRIQTILYQWAKRDLSDVFDQVFKNRNVEDAELRVDNIDFDLGDVPENFFLSETCSRLKEKLEQFLYPKLENQRKTACLKILINSCKKFAPEVATSKVEEIFYSVYQAEESIETIINKVIAILKKTYPALSFDEMTGDIFKGISFIKGKEKNVYLLNVLEKIYSSFFQEQEDIFIQTFLTSTIPHYSSEGYLDLLMHFVLEMQEKHSELNDIQKSENLFFNQPDNKINIALKQIFNDICISALPGGSSVFINDFIKKTKESNPSITSLGITVLFIDELKKKYPHLNDFRLSNFDENQSPNLSKNYWKDEIKAILWDFYKSIFISEGTPTDAENIDAENIETIEAEANERSASEGDVVENKENCSNGSLLESGISKNSAVENNASSDVQESNADSHEKALSESSDSENSAAEVDEQNQESADISSDTQNKAESSDAESLSAENIESAKINAVETDAANTNASESDPLESNADNNNNLLSESGDSEDSISSEANEQSRESVDVADDTQDKAKNSGTQSSDIESPNAENIETAKTEAENFNAEKIEVAEAEAVETDAANTNASESAPLESNADSSKNLLSKSDDSETSASEVNEQGQESADASSDTRNKAESSDAENSSTERSNAESIETAENEVAKTSGASLKNEAAGANIPGQENTEKSDLKHSSFETNSAEIQTSENFDKIFNECFDEFSSPETKCSPLKITESFISKLQKEFPDQAVFDNVVKAYQKATELEMKYNSAAGKKDEILVKDAGLVLVGAYVPTLFKKLEYIADGAFVSEQARLKACRLLRYIVFGDLPSDGLYFLGNYFCGLPWNFRIPKEIVLDDNEKKIAESLVMSIIENWKAIGHVSIDGFRGTFLHREGKIEKETDEEIYLKVKQGPFDMLLDRLPWSYSMLKFKWHKKLLSTIWR